MVAIATPTPAFHPRRRPALHVVAPADAHLHEPRDGVRAATAGPAAGWLLWSVLALVVSLAVGYLGASGPDVVDGSMPMLEQTHEVVAGETMWSIANEVAPAGEAATYVERLVEANGASVVAPGQVLRLPLP